MKLISVFIFIILTSCVQENNRHKYELTSPPILAYDWKKSSEIECANNIIQQAIEEMPKNFYLLKEIPFFTNYSSKRKQDLILNKGQTYWFGLNSPNNTSNGMIGLLYNENMEKVFSTYYDNDFDNGIIFSCNRTGKYSFKIAFNNYDAKNCPEHLLGTNRVIVGAILGMRKR